MKVRYWIYIFILLAVVTRLWGIGEKSFWIDELESLRVAKDLSYTIQYCKAGNTPPLRYIMHHYLMNLSPTEFIVRSPSMLFGILTIPVIFLLVRKLFNVQTALIATFLLSLSPWHIFHSQDGRMYSVFFFFVTLSIYLTFLALDRKKYIYWILLGATWAVNAYITYFALWTSFVIFLFLSLVYIKDIRKIPFKWNPPSLPIGILLCLVAAGIVYTPWLYNLRFLMEKYHVSIPFINGDSELPPDSENTDNPEPKIENTSEEKPPIRLNPYLTNYNKDYFIELVQKLGCKNLSVSFFILGLFLVGLISCFKYNRLFFTFSLLWIFIPVAILLKMGSVNFFFPHRYLFYQLLIYIILVSHGLYWISLKIGSLDILKQKTYFKTSITNIVSTVILVLILIFFITDNIDYYQKEKQDWKGAVKYLEYNVYDGDAIVTGAGWSELGFLHYSQSLKRRRVQVYIHIIKVELLNKIFAENDSLWFIIWGPIPDQVKMVVDHHLYLEKTFPGILGDVYIYRKKTQ